MRRGTVLAAALLIAGCAGSGDQNDGSALWEDDVTASVEVDVMEDSVRLVLHVTNTSDSAIELRFPTSQRYDFVVTTPEGEEVWRWSDGMAFLQALSRASLGPGDSWDMEAVWEPGDVTGELVATGILTAREPLRQRASFRLP